MMKPNQEPSLMGFPKISPTGPKPGPQPFLKEPESLPIFWEPKENWEFLIV